MTRLTDWFTVAIAWVPRLFMLQLIWLLQVLAGGVILGLAPATAVLAAQIRKYLDHQDARLEWRALWRLWRGELWIQQLLLGIPLAHAVLFGFGLWLARGTLAALPVAILTLVYGAWMLHLPAVVIRRRDDAGALALWLVGLRVIARSPWPLITTVALAISTVAASLFAPVGLLFFGVGAASLAAGLVVRHVLAPRRGAGTTPTDAAADLSWRRGRPSRAPSR